jgi:hypothetical protein
MDIASSAPAVYEIRINGRLDPENTGWFEGMTIIVNEEVVPPQTIICGWVRDQANLYGLISRARDLGLTLISVKRLPSAGHKETHQA